MEAVINKYEIFQNIFKDYEEFKEWYKGTDLSDNEEDVPDKKTFALIMNEYRVSHICTSVESFKGRFANDIYTYYKEFEATTAAIADLMKIKDNEIEIADSMIINVAEIPETESSTDEETVDFISNQQKTIQKKGLLQVKREQLSNKRTYTVKTFIKRFRHLFIKVLSPSYNYVVGELNDEE